MTTRKPAPSAGKKTTKHKVGFLVFAPMKAKRKDNSFKGNGNIGLRVVLRQMVTAGFDCRPCMSYTADDFPVVLVSMTSTYDIAEFLRQVRRLEWWQPGRRKFKVVVGGAGLTNPCALRHYADYAVVGRCEDWIADVVGCIFDGGHVSHPSVMPLPEMGQVVVGQADNLYPHKIGDWQETAIGCPNSCSFCLYRWTRKCIGHGGAYKNLTLAGEKSPELMFLDLLKLDRKLGRIRCAIDGFSERLRFKFGKRITDQQITDVINHVGSFEGTTVMTVYNICNMPTESEDDRLSLYRAIKAASPVNRVIFILHSTPFRPSNCTPAQWEAADITCRRGWRQQTIVDRENLLSKHSYTIETAWSHLLSLLIERARPEHDPAIYAALDLIGKTMKDDERVKHMKTTYPWAVDDAVRAYSIGDPCHPAALISGYEGRDRVARIAEMLRVNG